MPTATVVATAGPTLAPTAAPTATTATTAAPSATQAPTAPLREVRFIGLGLDAPDSPETPTERFITVTMDGPGEVSAAVSDVTAGRVRLCLWRGDAATRTDEACRDVRNGGVAVAATDAGQTQWTVSLIGATDQSSPTASVVIRFHALVPTVTIDRFRFAGEEFGNYNGFVAELAAVETGMLELAARWADDEGTAYPYRMLVEEIGSAAEPFEAEGGPTNETQQSAPLAADRSYRVTFANSVAIAETQVFLRATLSWP
ncbi:MAG TPA: hypothetical protein VK992_04475 [Candidatus Caenarcaniphilales bacterium]|nr:hypothetical protein [Candidatus Caenarcaniphilales bacterium]